MAPPHDESLRRELGFLDVLALAVGGTIGTGIFFLPGKAAAALGPAALVPILIGAVLATLLVLCFAEVGSRYRATGGAMTYAQAAFGDAAGFTVGWSIWASRVVSWAALANAFVTALVPLWPGAETLRPALLVALLGGLAAVNLRGVAAGAKTNTWLTVAKLVPLALFIALGLAAVDTAAFTPFAPQGYDALGSTTVLLFYAYVGFEGLVVPAAEMRNPQRAVPRALTTGIAVVAVVYLGVWTVCQGTLPALAGANNPVGEAAQTFLGGPALLGVQAGIVISALGINALMALVAPRALYGLAQRGWLPQALAGTNRRDAPHVAILLSTGLALALALTGTFEQLAVISVVARMAQYVPTCAAVLVLRRRADAPAATFRVPLGPVVPVAAIATCGWLLTQTATDRLLGGLGAIGVGLLLYAGFRRRHR